MQKKPTLKEKLAIIAFAALVVGLLVGVIVLLDWLEVDLKWFRFVGWTGFVFGILAYGCAHDLKKIRSLSVFVALVSVHVVIWTVYLRSGSGFPRFFMVVAPLEVGIGALIMTFVGGVRPRLLRHRKYRPGGDFWTDRNDNEKQTGV